MAQPLIVRPGKAIRLKDFDPDYTNAVHDRKKAEKEHIENIAALDDLGYRLYAEGRRALLVVLQGMDTSGKDGTIRKAMQGFNPQTCRVTSFKGPSAEELSHDFLWRINRALPRKGEIGIFNRSHYEDVLIVRVHDLVPRSEWKTRYDRINMFERLLIDAGTTIVKIFLHISKDEQRKRLQSRIDDPRKMWKFNQDDLSERRYWSAYEKAYDEALTRCNTDDAPWHIVPANHKWYRNLIVSRILRKSIDKLAPQFPPPQPGIKGIVVK